MKNKDKAINNINQIEENKADSHLHSNKKKPANDGFKSDDKSQGLTWQEPMDEQGAESNRLSDNEEED